MAYKTVPLDEETHQQLLELCVAYEMGQRAQGAMIRKLVRAEHKKLADAKLLGSIEPVEDGESKPTVKKPRIRST